MGVNDGPLLNHWENSSLKIKNKISNWEYSTYNLSNQLKPDLLIKWVVSKDVSKKRKPETKDDHIIEKKEIVENLKYDGTDIYTINTEKSLEETKLEIKNVIWEKINEKS